MHAFTPCAVRSLPWAGVWPSVGAGGVPGKPPVTRLRSAKDERLGTRWCTERACQTRSLSVLPMDVISAPIDSESSSDAPEAALGTAPTSAFTSALGLLQAIPSKKMLLSKLCAILYKQGFKSEIAAAGGPKRYFLSCPLLVCEFHCKPGYELVTLPEAAAVIATSAAAAATASGAQNASTFAAVGGAPPADSARAAASLPTGGNAPLESEQETPLGPHNTKFLPLPRIIGSTQLDLLTGGVLQLSISSPDANSTSSNVNPQSYVSVSITWACTFPTPSLEEERALHGVILPGRPKDWKRPGFEPFEYHLLPEWRKAEIGLGVSRVGVRLGQALSLRSLLLRSAAPWKYHGKEAGAAAAGARFEVVVERFLAAHAVHFSTQEQQLLAARERGELSGPTPDFLILSPLTINGAVVKWIEVKRFFGSAERELLKDWAPPVKIAKQLEKYVSAFGPGAIVLRHGYGSAFDAPDGVLLLDPSPFDAEIDVDYVE